LKLFRDYLSAILKTGCKQPSGSLKATKSTFKQTIQIKIK